MTPSGRTTRTTLSTVAESNIVVGHDFRNREKQQLELGVTGGARFVRQGGATPRARGRLSAAVGCTQPTSQGSPAVTATRSTRPSQPWQSARPTSRRATTPLSPMHQRANRGREPESDTPIRGASAQTCHFTAPRGTRAGHSHGTAAGHALPSPLVPAAPAGRQPDPSARAMPRSATRTDGSDVTRELSCKHSRSITISDDLITQTDNVSVWVVLSVRVGHLPMADCADSAASFGAADSSARSVGQPRGRSCRTSALKVPRASASFCRLPDV